MSGGLHYSGENEVNLFHAVCVCIDSRGRGLENEIMCAIDYTLRAEVYPR